MTSTPASGRAPVRVVFLNNFAGPTLGGGEVQLLTLLRGMDPSAIEATVVCARGSALEAEARDLGVRAVSAAFEGVSVRAMAKAIARELDGPAIVQGTGFLTNVIARQLGPMLGARVVNTVHVVPGAARLDGESWARGLVRTTLDRTSRARVDRFIAVSAAVAGKLIADGADPETVTVIRNGLDLERLREAARAGRGSEPAGVVQVGYLGRLESVKGCEYFILTVAELAARYPHVDFVVAGDGSERANLEQLADRMGVADRVRFLGYVDNDAAFLAGLAVAVVPSLSEASGLTAIEALALSVPLVATRVGGLPEVVTDGETGLLVSPADPDATADAVARLLDDPTLAEALAANGRRYVESEFTADRMARDYEALYRELAAR